MALLRFYSTGVPCYRDESADEKYSTLVNRFNNGFGSYPSDPATNISETDKEYSIRMALPGVLKEDIRVDHDKGYLTISIVKNVENKEDGKYSLREFNYSGASRTFKTGKGIDVEKITARHENGILTVNLPKKEPVNIPVRSVTVA
jgi:HSP20 family protein